MTDYHGIRLAPHMASRAGAERLRLGHDYDKEARADRAKEFLGRASAADIAAALSPKQKAAIRAALHRQRMADPVLRRAYEAGQAAFHAKFAAVFSSPAVNGREKPAAKLLCTRLSAQEVIAQLEDFPAQSAAPQSPWNAPGRSRASAVPTMTPQAAAAGWKRATSYIASLAGGR